MAEPPPRPRYAFIVPTLDEEDHIEACVRSLLGQDYPPDRLEVLVVDGGSADATRTVVAGIAASDPRVRLLDNPARTAPHAFNIGLDAARDADVVSITSGHGVMHPDFARTAVDALEESGALLVGGRTVAVPGGDSLLARGIARAWMSPFGIGGARHHYADQPGWVDTAYPSAYRRELVEAVGRFDEELVRNQDDDYHFRAARLGWPMRYDPRLRAEYHARASLTRLARQYFEYGYWRTRTLAKHGAVASPRQLVPAAFVAGLAAGALTVHRPRAGRAWRAAVAAYGAVLVAAALRERPDAGILEAGATSVAVATIHGSYGVGFWAGVARLAGQRARPRPLR